MQQPRMVPPIAQLRQQISRDNAKPIQSPLSFGQQPMQSPAIEQAASIAESVQDLALEIYAQLAVKHISANQTASPQTLKDLAQSAQQAALAYFHQLGVQFEGDDHGQS